MIVEGVVLRIGEPNSNGWLIPEEEAGRVIESLPSTPLTLSSKEHTNERVVGTVVDAWRDGDNVVARAEVNDPDVRDMMLMGELPRGWSLNARGHISNSVARDIEIDSLTIVRNPAYKEAEFRMVENREEIGDKNENKTETENEKKKDFEIEIESYGLTVGYYDRESGKWIA
ncbi:hypothetical protein DRN72_04380 [Methanosarcinales archaeon]|nr:MAG: hypothetical protein DRN72_04380 [Methanosarcinales archaeon]